MFSLPWASADISQWIGPSQIASSGQDVEVDGWNVPSNATILDGWMTAEDTMVYGGNGTDWRVDTTTNFSVGQFSDTTMDHFGGQLSLEPDSAVSQVESFQGNVQLNFNNWPEFGNTSIWEPGLPGSVTNGTQIGQTRVMSYGSIPASAPSGSIVAATIMDGAVPGGEVAAIRSPSITIPSPVNHFNLTVENWRHTGSDDAVWVEYKLDSGNWTWLEPVGGYNSNATLSATATPDGTPSNSTTFPAWTNSNATGWVTNIFNLDNLTGINNSATIKIRFRISTDVNTPGRPGWFIDDVELTNVGGATNYWHHGCYSVSATTCSYSNNADAALQRTLNLSGLGGSATLRTVLEWDLEGSSYDNFWVEMSTNNNTWTDLTGTTYGIPGYSYSIGGTTYTDETNGFVTLDLSIPTTFHVANAYLRYRVETDGSVTSGGTYDNLEGLTLDSISVLDANGSVHVHDSLNSASTMFHYSAGGINDWQYIAIGAGAVSLSYGFEDSQPGSSTGIPAGWSSSGDWEFGPLQSQPSEGPTVWPSAPFGWGTNLAGAYSGSTWSHLYTPSYAIPAGASARLTFAHWMCMESGYDGGAVFISTDNQTWNHFDPGNNWYDASGLTSHFGANLANVGVFNGATTVPPGGFNCQGPHSLWSTKTADLATYSGQTVWFRFSIESDSIISYDGWYVDDIGLEVDYFLDEGDWISDALILDDLGNGFVDIDGVVPEDTWATGSILDSSGNIITGFSNLSFPISLHGLDRDSHTSIKVQVHMGTDNPFLTPVVDAVHVGSIRWLDARGTGNGWDVSPSLDLWDKNLTNNGSSVLQISSSFVHSSRPILGVDFTGIGSQVAIRATDSNGNVIGSTGISGTISFVEPQPGFGIQIDVNPGGRISSLWAEGDFGKPALNPEADIASDGTIDWSFPKGSVYGYHGWQQLLYQSTTSSGTVNHVLDTTSTGLQIGSSGGTVSVLVPEDATVQSAVVSVYVSSLTDPTPSPVDISVGSSPSVTFTDGFSTVSLSPSFIAHVNMVQPTHNQVQNGRDWRVVDFDLSSTGLALVDINAITIGYSIAENVTGITQQLVDYHRNELQSTPGSSSIDIPVTYTADSGAVIIDGGIHHELMITNYPFVVPTTMYPDGNVVEITTRHRHLYDNSEISKITLTGVGSDGSTIQMQVSDPSNAATFSQLSGQSQLPMETDCTVTEIAQGNLGNDVLEIGWRFRVSWTWDDVSEIEWSALGYNSSGDAIAPATAQSGGSGSQAIENDLEISGFEVYDGEGRHLSNQFSPDYPFHSRSGLEISVSGHLRFQNTVDTRPLQNDFAMIVNVSGIEQPLTSNAGGTFSGNVTLMPGFAAHTLSPSIGRVGPVTGATGANDSTINPPQIIVQIDDEAPEAGNFLVSTSAGLLDANGYVWDPINPLTVHITVSDAQDRSDEVKLHYWREGIDDSNADGFPQAHEYQTMTESLYALRSGSQQVTFSGIQVASNGFNAQVSLWLEGTDWAGNSYQDGGTGGGPGLASDWATLQTAQNTETTLLNTGFALDTVNEYLLAGQIHTFSMMIQDANGVQTLDDIAVYLAGQSEAPLGQFNYDPRQDTLSTVSGSHVEPISATITTISADTSRLDIVFSVDWDTPVSQTWYVPGVTVTDDTSTVANLNNLNAMRWKLDNVLTAIASNLTDLTPPFTQTGSNSINVQEGDEFLVSGNVFYAATNTPVQIPMENLSVRALMLYGSTPIEKVVPVEIGGYFNAPLVLPMRSSTTPQIPVELTVLGVPGSGSTVPNSDTIITIDSDSPEVIFDTVRFPVTSLTRLESDQLSANQVDIIIHDTGGMDEDNITMYWEYYRNGLPRLGMGGSATLPFVYLFDGGDYHFGSDVDMRPKDGEKLLEGDQISVWFEGTDIAGNELTGDGTDNSPRVPLLEIIEFVPELVGWVITPVDPIYGENVEILVQLINTGVRGGELNISLVEFIDDNWYLHDTQTLVLTSKDSDASVLFNWEAWKPGDIELHIYFGDDSANRTAVPAFEVTGEEESGSGSSTTLFLGALIGLLVIVVVGLLAVIVLRKPSESIDEYEEMWDEEPQFGVAFSARLDYEDETLWNTVSRHGIYDKDAFLAHAKQYDRDNDGFLDAEELDRAATDFTRMLSQQTKSTEAVYPLDFNDETVAYIITSNNILDKSAFMHFAHSYDEDNNGYLKHSELTRAATDYVESGRNSPSPLKTSPEPRRLAVAEVISALPEWDEGDVNAWMDKGWTAQQIIHEHASPVKPPAPTGYGEDFIPAPESDGVEVSADKVEPLEPVDVVDAVEIPSEASLKRLKKAELVELAELQGINSSGTKADIIKRLLN